MNAFRQRMINAALFLITSLFSLSSAQDNAAQRDMLLTAQTSTAVLEAAIRALNSYYVFPETAKKMEQALREHARGKAYDGITSAAEFARTLTQQLQEVSHDKHLRVNYSAAPVPEEAATEASPQEREFQRRVNYGFEKLERLRGNVGYVDLRGFMDANAGSATVAAAMNFLAHTDALIFDLRDNNGGEPEMVALISSYLFESPTHLNDLYSRFDNRTQEYWTQVNVSGTRYLNKAVYVLTSRYTFSAGEEFTYNLKNLKRATIVGEVTGGGAHPTQRYRLHENFSIGVPFARAINPITKTNWEGTGVQPDVAVPAAQALRVAHIAALKNILGNTTEPQRRDQLEETIAALQSEITTPPQPTENNATLEGPPLPPTPSGKTLRQFLTAFNTGNLAAMQRFHEEHGGNPNNANEDFGFYRQCGGLILQRLVSVSDYEIETLVQARNDQRWLKFGITVEAAEPYGIADIRVRPASAPNEAEKK